MLSYDASHFDLPAPVARVILRNPRSGATVSDVLLLVNTGADVTLLPRMAVERFGVPLLAGQRYDLMGFDGSKSFAPVVVLDMLFLGCAFRGRYLLIEEERGILGRDILNHVTLLLNGPQRQWSEHAPESAGVERPLTLIRNVGASAGCGAEAGRGWPASRPESPRRGGAGHRDAPPQSWGKPSCHVGPCPRGGLASRGHDPGRRPCPLEHSGQLAESQVTRHATVTTRPSRSGAMAWRNGSGAAFIWRLSKISPAWFMMQPSMVQACRSLPPANGCGLVEKRLRSPPRSCVSGFPGASRPSGDAPGEASIVIRSFQRTVKKLRFLPPVEFAR
jgi:hypothetical protein